MTSAILGIPEGEPGEIMAHSHKKPGKCDEFCQIVIAEVEPNRSEIGKRVNFGLAYGSEGHKLVATALWKDINGLEHPVTWMMLEEGMRRWANEFPLAASFKLSCVSEAKKNNGYAITEYGRARYFGDILKNPTTSQFKKAERDLVNHRIQSPSASLLNRTLILIEEMKQELVQSNQIQWDDFYLACTVHDSCTYMVKDEYVPWFKECLMKYMHRPVPEFNNHVFKADCGVGKTWFEAENNSKVK
jgi:DNA polymerase I-like protein with 3'-5' exonuclease and polymerase domains